MHDETEGLAEELARIEAAYNKMQPIERYRVLDQPAVWVPIIVLTVLGLIALLIAAAVA